MLKNNGFHNRHSPILRAFSPLSLFAGGAPGAWYDPSDLTTLFQDSAGTTPVTAVEQPVGLMLDKSQGLVLGPELVVNGTFSSGISGWSVISGSIEYDGANQRLKVNSTGSTYVSTSMSTTAGKTYKIEISFASSNSSTRIGFSDGFVTFGAQFTQATAAGSYVIFLTASSSQPGFTVLFQGGSASTQYIDNVSVKELPGNHAFQATSASRPVLSARVNKLLATATLATQSVTTRATAHTLRFEGAGSVTLTGTAIGVYTAGTHSVTTTAGTLTLTVLGSVTSADLRETNDGVGVPTYQAVVTSTNYDTTGFLPYLKFDGVDDSLSTNSISFTSTDKMSVFAGVRKLSDAATAMLVELSANTSTNVGAFAALAPRTTSVEYSIFYKGTASLGAGNLDYSDLAAPNTSVLTSALNLAGATAQGVATARINGASIVLTFDPGNLGGGNFGNYPLFIGRRGGSSFPFNGQMYSLIIVGKAVTAGELSSTETWVNSKTGAY